MASDFLFELGTEELPSGAVWPLAEALAGQLETALAKAQLQYGRIQAYAAPRRLAVLIEAVDARQPDQTITRLGPAAASGLDEHGQPTPALQGFARSCGVPAEQLTTTSTDKGERWVFEAVKPGQDTAALLPDMIRHAIAALPVPKPMRWGDGDEEFARPVHWAVLLFGDEVISTDILGVTTGRHSIGHRFHHPKPVVILSPLAYASALKEAFVIADFKERRRMIVKRVNALAAQHDYIAVMPDALVDEVTSIVEWPEPLMAHFEAAFLDVPAEALIASMQSHQKCFALQNSAGQLQPYFITVANIASTNPEQVVSGNEKVMRARLSDAAFFYQQDKKKPLFDYLDATTRVVFQKRLGSLNDKAMRTQALMDYLAQPLSLDRTHASRSAELSKCDLMTGMVGEFPELQGLMGYYYALNDGEPRPVAIALNEQYLPRFAADSLPQSSLGLALSLADRMDTLVGIFGIGQKPSGVKDPFKLRRHALAVVRLLMKTAEPVNLSTLIRQALMGYGEEVSLDETAVADLKPFILERLQSYYQGQEVPLDVVQAVRVRQDDWLFDLDKRVQAVLDFIRLPQATSLAAACKRVNNILQKSSSSHTASEIDKALLQDAAEIALLDEITRVEQQVQDLYLEGEYGEILAHLAKLRDPVDLFFDKVMVMVEDEAIKSNRLSILARLQWLLQGVADISLLTIEK